MAILGRNRATNVKKSFVEYASTGSSKCIFLSHATKDKNAVREIGEYIKKSGIDIYFDEEDSDLQRAVLLSTDNDDLVTRCIERGLELSTNIFCIVSEDTKSSWWVPYEVGYGKRSSDKIATLLLEDVNIIPSYLKIVPTIGDIYDLNIYLKELSPAPVKKAFQYSSHNPEIELAEASYDHPLSNYMKSFRN